MLITAKTEIRGIHMELSVTDAKDCLKNPKKLQTEIRTILENYGVKLGPEHLGVTEEEKPFICPWCRKGYVHEARLETHKLNCPKLVEEDEL